MMQLYLLYRKTKNKPKWFENFENLKNYTGIDKKEFDPLGLEKQLSIEGEYNFITFFDFRKKKNEERFQERFDEFDELQQECIKGNWERVQEILKEENCDAKSKIFPPSFHLACLHPGFGIQREELINLFIEKSKYDYQWIYVSLLFSFNYLAK